MSGWLGGSGAGRESLFEEGPAFVEGIAAVHGLAEEMV